MAATIPTPTTPAAKGSAILLASPPRALALGALGGHSGISRSGVGGGSGSTPAVAITNTVKGNYFAPEDNRAADAPLQVRLNGTGRVNGLGKVKLSGSLALGGFRMAGSDDVNGTLTLSAPGVAARPSR